MLYFGLKVSLIGMGVVYIALILLVFIIKGFSSLVALMDRQKKTVAAEPAASAAPVMFLRDTGRESEGEIAAVIAAAVASYRGRK